MFSSADSFTFFFLAGFAWLAMSFRMFEVTGCAVAELATVVGWALASCADAVFAAVGPDCACSAMETVNIAASASLRRVLLDIVVLLTTKIFVLVRELRMASFIPRALV